MSGETEQTPSGWTVDTGLAHLQMAIDEADRRYEQRFVAQEKAVAFALDAAKEAVLKAEIASEKRFDSVNEFRQTLSDQTNTFLPRAEAEQRIKQNSDKIDASKDLAVERFSLLLSRLDKLEGRSTGMKDGWGYLVGAIGLAATVIAIVIAIRP